MRPVRKVRKVPLAGGRVELRLYRNGRLLEVRRTSPAGAKVRPSSYLAKAAMGGRFFDFTRF